MEITLNLLPAHLLQQREVQKRKRARIAIAAAAVLPVLLAHGLLHARIQLLQAQATSLNRQVAALTPVAGKARKLEGDLATLRRREDALTRLGARQSHWSSVLVRLSALIPSDVSLTSLSITGGQLAITGQALSEGTVSTLATRLAAAPFLSGSSLKYVRGDGQSGRVFTFEIDGTLRAEKSTP